ncbi:hydrolase [Biscogniauxia sp. FL1348]|nr:hydrolase [Biscogniauxia sp. FL1348]
MTKTIIRNVLVFDGEDMSGPKTVVIDGPQIASIDDDDDDDEQHDVASDDATVIDGTGCTLLPGLIDCHVHMRDEAQLASCARFGVTAVCDMGYTPAAQQAALRAAARRGPTHWLGAGLPAYAARSRHGRLFRLLGVGDEHAVAPASGSAPEFVADRVRADAADYIKVIADEPGLAQETLDALAGAARGHGLRSVAHAAHHAAFARALRAGFDVLTHVPMDRAVGADLAARLAAAGAVAVPTLAMSEALAASWLLAWPMRGGRQFAPAAASVAALRAAGVPVLAGTDANNSGALLAGVPAGRALHRELELLVAQGGLSPLEALRAATGLPARYFPRGLGDRGRVGVGRRADLVLVQGNPAEDITATRRLRRVWSAGEEVESVVRMDEEGEGWGWGWGWGCGVM